MDQDDCETEPKLSFGDMRSVLTGEYKTLRELGVSTHSDIYILDWEPFEFLDITVSLFRLKRCLATPRNGQNNKTSSPVPVRCVYVDRTVSGPTGCTCFES